MGIQVPLPGGPHDTAEDLLRVGASPGAVASTHLARDHERSDRVFGPPIGGIDRRDEQKAPEGLKLVREMPGEARTIGDRSGAAKRSTSRVMRRPRATARP
jgi:hypothetical protein